MLGLTSGSKEGLKDKPRSGRPPDVPGGKLSKIVRELSENPSGWKAKEIMDIIHGKKGVMKFIYTGYYTSGGSSLKSQERGLITLYQMKKRSGLKKV